MGDFFDLHLSVCRWVTATGEEERKRDERRQLPVTFMLFSLSSSPFMRTIKPFSISHLNCWSRIGEGRRESFSKGKGVVLFHPYALHGVKEQRGECTAVTKLGGQN